MITDWDRRFPRCEPVGHHLRQAFPQRWVRFHSLPGSKRYPESEADYEEILTRHNTVLGELAQLAGEVILVTTGYSSTVAPLRDSPEVAAFDRGAAHWRTIAMHEIEGDEAPRYWHLYSSRWHWRPGVFDPLVRLIADDCVANVLVVAHDCRWALHPYDGGMDVITESSGTRNAMRDKHATWLSAREDGL